MAAKWWLLQLQHFLHIFTSWIPLKWLQYWKTITIGRPVSIHFLRETWPPFALAWRKAVHSLICRFSMTSDNVSLRFQRVWCLSACYRITTIWKPVAEPFPRRVVNTYIWNTIVQMTAGWIETAFCILTWVFILLVATTQEMACNLMAVERWYIAQVMDILIHSMQQVNSWYV